MDINLIKRDKMEFEKIIEEAVGRYPRYIENPQNINALLKWEEDKEFQIKQQCFITGAEWQANRMYSEEEVNEIIAEIWLSVEDNEGDETFSQARERILEQFKKTKDGI